MKKITVSIADAEKEVTFERTAGNPTEPGQVSVTIDGRSRSVQIVSIQDNAIELDMGGRIVRFPYSETKPGDFVLGNDLIPVEISARDYRESHYVAGASGAQEGALVVNMPGKIVAVLVNEGDSVEAGQGLVIVEAMKMENELKAGKSGVVSSIKVTAGDTVESGALLLEIED